MAKRICTNCGGNVVGAKNDKGTPAENLCTSCVKSELRNGVNPFSKPDAPAEEVPSGDESTALVDA